MRETTSFADIASDFIESVFETGDITPFGPQGRGRTRKAQILGEYRTNADLQFEVSYDSGQTWSIVNWSVTGFAGDKFAREWRLPQQKREAMRFRGTIKKTNGGSAGEGLVLNELALEVERYSGMPRLTAAHRA